jgi:hypothetical protein
MSDPTSEREEEAMGLIDRAIERLAGASDRLDHLYRRRKGGGEEEGSEQGDGADDSEGEDAGGGADQGEDREG